MFSVEDFALRISHFPLNPSHPCPRPQDDHNDQIVSNSEWQESCWEVINSYFKEKGLVRQQLDSFNDFVSVTLQEIIDSTPPMEVEANPQHTSNDMAVPVRRQITLKTLG